MAVSRTDVIDHMLTELIHQRISIMDSEDLVELDYTFQSQKIRIWLSSTYIQPIIIMLDTCLCRRPSASMHLDRVSLEHPLSDNATVS